MKVLFSLLFVFVFLSTSWAQPVQQVFLDFDSGTDGNINYTQQMRDDVQAGFEDLFQYWNFSFSQTSPGGPFSTLTFNRGNTGGLAEGIDFRNLDRTDNAIVNIDGMGWTDDSDIVSSSVVIGAHELGHLLGLRHHDSMGAIGTGIIPGLRANRWSPEYQGPQNAVETLDHIMASPSSVGSTFDDSRTPSWFSERSAIKLTSNEVGSVIAETSATNNSIGTAQILDLVNMVVPNTLQSGRYSHLPSFDVDAITVVGDLNFLGDRDYYGFTGQEGDLINIELMSVVLDRFEFTYFDTVVSLLDENGNYVDYHGVDATNDDELEATDSQILDLVLPSDGTYYIEVMAWFDSDFGQYELFMHRFNDFIAIPEPSSFVIGLLGLSLLRRRRNQGSAC